MTNLISVNAQMFQNMTPFLNMVWSSPLQIVICIYILWRYLGIAAFAGFATTIVFIPLNVFTAKKSKRLCDKKLKAQDLRLKILNEILSGMLYIMKIRDGQNVKITLAFFHFLFSLLFFLRSSWVQSQVQSYELIELMNALMHDVFQHFCELYGHN